MMMTLSGEMAQLGDDGLQDDEAEGDENGEMGENVEIDGEGGSDNGGVGESVNGEVSVPQYSHQPGCSVAFESDSPLQYISLIFTPDKLRHIVEQTNL